MLNPDTKVRTLVETSDIFGIGTVPVHAVGRIVDVDRDWDWYLVAITASEELTLHAEYDRDELMEVL